MSEQLAYAPQKSEQPLSWPADFDHSATLSIGRVVEMLKSDFPTVAVSKIRFFEEQGLVSPVRSGSGYRKYSLSDVERLRYVLAQQRDSYKPLKVIREELAEIDAGRQVRKTQRMQVVAKDGNSIIPNADVWVSGEEIEMLTGASTAFLDEAVREGLLKPASSGRFPARSVKLVTYLLQLSSAGIALRNCMPLVRAARRQAEILVAARAPYANLTSPLAIERELAQVSQIVEDFSKLFGESLREAVENNDL